MLSGTHERTQVLRSGDGGATWEDITAGLPRNIGFTAPVHVLDQSTFLVGTKAPFNDDENTNVGVYRTDNGGITWDRVLDVEWIGRPLVLADGTMHWLLARDLAWSRAPTPVSSVIHGAGPSADPAMSLVALPDGRIATTADDFVITSADGGTMATRRPAPTVRRRRNHVFAVSERALRLAIRLHCRDQGGLDCSTRPCPAGRMRSSLFNPPHGSLRRVVRVLRGCYWCQSPPGPGAAPYTSRSPDGRAAWTKLEPTSANSTSILNVTRLNAAGGAAVDPASFQPLR